MPTAISQVLQKMRNDAESIFYSWNHFLTSKDTSWNEALPILLFLRKIPARTVKYLYHVTSVNPFLFENMDSARGQWSEVFDTLVLKGNFSRFNLTLDLAYQTRHTRYDERFETPGGPPEKVIETVFGRGLLAAERLAELIKKCDRLKNLFFHLSGPLQSDQDACRHQREIEIERKAMGERYESVVSGKHKRRHAWNGYPCGEYCSSCPGQNAEWALIVRSIFREWPVWP
jgi:hypothetical protein